MSDRLTIALAGLLPLLFYGALLAFGGLPVLDGVLWDPDCYVRLMRVTRLADTGQWYDGFEPLLNAPNGLEMHWTRPFDVLMLAGTLPGLAVTDFDNALYWWGVVISPLLACITLALLAWGGLTILPRWGVLMMAVLFLMQPGLYAIFQLGRPDHHSLLAALAAAMLALLLRWIDRPERRAYPIMAGLVTALGLWVGTETLLMLLIATAGLGLMWLAGRVEAATALWRYTVFFALGVAVALAIERPPGDWVAVELDRLSLVHIVLALAMVAAAGLIAVTSRLAPGSRLSLRLLVGFGAAFVPTVVIAVGFPDFFEGPYGQVSPEVQEVFLANVSEAIPLVTSDRTTWPEAILALGPIVFALPFAVYHLCRGGTDQQNAYILLTFALVMCVAAAMVQLRVLPYAELVLVLVWSTAVVALLRRAVRLRSLMGRVVAGGLGLVVLLFGHIVVAAMMASSSAQVANKGNQLTCNWPLLAEFLRDWPADGTVLTYIYPAPEIAWRAKRGVVTAPYHRMANGIADAHQTFLASPDEARALLTDRQVALIVLCAGQGARGGHDWYLEQSEPDGFYRLLASDRHPAWIKRVGLDDPRVDGFKVFSMP